MTIPDFHIALGQEPALFTEWVATLRLVGLVEEVDETDSLAGCMVELGTDLLAHGGPEGGVSVIGRAVDTDTHTPVWRRNGGREGGEMARAAALIARENKIALTERRGGQRGSASGSGGGDEDACVLLYDLSKGHRTGSPCGGSRSGRGPHGVAHRAPW